jgi:hypothetical protein
MRSIHEVISNGISSVALNYAGVGRTARHATLENDTSLTFESGTVDFSPKRRVVPGEAPNFFPQ